MQKEIGIFDEMKKTLDELNGKGILLVAGDPPNVMTIGWGTLGVIWHRSIFTIMVRPTRYTFGKIEKSATFSVCILPKGYEKQLAFCGSKSGKDVDKIQHCGFTMEPGIKTDTPYIGESMIHYECRIVHKHRLDPQSLDGPIDKQFYPKKDYHIVYYGEILGVYRKEG
ncbi:MAG: flavin reductase family protein [Saccharofermentanaceae bacterium]|jgi:flavin reductase (DIM6/NTAB) family NADH-FMN oxidoreductase RutF|nr:flavin reductase family protein [Bacteroidales bacterium]